MARAGVRTIDSDRAVRNAVFNELVFTLFRAHGAVTAHGERLLPAGLTVARWQVIKALTTLGRAATVPQIARTLSISRQATQKQVDLLLAQELVALRDNPDNARSPLVALTREGQLAHAKGTRSWLLGASALGVEIEVDELESARNVIERVIAKLPPSAAEPEEG
jgi:DNA-binding MarR family transcriptional regulator